MPRKSVEPQRLYRQIAKQIQDLIKSGEFAVGSRLPAERDLATQLSVSRPLSERLSLPWKLKGSLKFELGLAFM